MGSFYESVAYVADHRSSGVDGGTFTAGAFRTRTINTEIYDPGGILSISGNQIALGEGDYDFEAWVVAHGPDFHISRLQNVTDGTTVFESGGNYYCYNTIPPSDFSSMRRRLTVPSGGRTYEIQHDGSKTRNNDGFGKACGFGTEVYLIACFRKFGETAQSDKWACFRDEKSSGVDGGTFSSGARRTRDLNVMDDPSGFVVDFSSNQITLEAGEYEAFFTVPGHDVDQHQGFLYDTTGAADLLIGSCADAPRNFFQKYSVIAGVFEISTESTIEVQNRCIVSKATVGFGLAGGFGTECYTSGHIRKL